jgi:hypothetical protein
MNRFGGYQAGKAFLIGRHELIAALELLQADKAFDQEMRRRRHISVELERTQEDIKARQVKLPVSATPELAHCYSLPFGIRVARPGLLEVEFASAEDLLARLFELVQLAGRDLSHFETVLTDCR